MRKAGIAAKGSTSMHVSNSAYLPFLWIVTVAKYYFIVLLFTKMLSNTLNKQIIYNLINVCSCFCEFFVFLSINIRAVSMFLVIVLVIWVAVCCVCCVSCIYSLLSFTLTR